MTKYLLFILFPIVAMAGTFRADNIIDNGLSTSQAVVSDGSKQLSSLPYTSTVTNSSIVSRDTNGNSGFNNTGVTVTSTAATGQTITMSAGSTGRQRITGSGNITFNLPDATTVLSGWSFYFNNLSTGVITLNRQDGSTLVATMQPGAIYFVACLDNSTVQGVWAATPWLTPTAVSNTAGTTVPGFLAATTLANNSVVFTDANHTLVGGSFSGDASNSGSVITINSGIITNAKLANMASSTIKCNITQGTASPQDCTMAQVSPALSVFLGDSGSGGQVGAVKAPAAGDTGAGKFLMANGTWSVPLSNIQPSPIYGAVISSTGAAWQASTVAIPACSPLGGTNVDWSLSNCFTKKLAANTTLTFSNRVAGQTVILRIENTGANYTLTFPRTATQGNSVLWAGSTPPVLSTGQATDVFTIFYDGTEMYGNVVANFPYY